MNRVPCPPAKAFAPPTQVSPWLLSRGQAGWVGLRWESRSWWCSSWRSSCCTAMATSRSSSAWSCSARCWPGTSASSSSSFFPWTSARSVFVLALAQLHLLSSVNSIILFFLLLVALCSTDYLQTVHNRPRRAHHCSQCQPRTGPEHNSKHFRHTH